MGRGWKNFEKSDGETLVCCGYAVSRSMVIDNLVRDDSEGNEEHHEETVSSNVDIKGAAMEGSGGNEHHAVGNWRKVDPCYIGAEILAGLCPAVMWKEERVIMNLGI